MKHPRTERTRGIRTHKDFPMHSGDRLVVRNGRGKVVSVFNVKRSPLYSIKDLGKVVHEADVTNYDR